jgi:pimeloyl-ACP methyl ester carboxylesterase
MSYLLVHGAGMGASCWDLLTPLLDGPVVAVDLPGRGTRSGVDLATVTLADCAAAVIEDSAGLTDITVVAHSFAGVSVPRVLPQLADRVRHVVFLAAVVPPDGTRVLDQIDPDVRAFVEQSIDGGIYRQEREAARAMLCNDVDPQRSEWLLDRITADSAALLSEAVDLSGLEAAVPRTYIRTAQDHCYVAELQERSAQRVGGAVITLPTGHMPMVSQPQALADLLSAVG